MNEKFGYKIKMHLEPDSRIGLLKQDKSSDS